VNKSGFKSLQKIIQSTCHWVFFFLIFFNYSIFSLIPGKHHYKIRKFFQITNLTIICYSRNLTNPIKLSVGVLPKSNLNLEWALIVSLSCSESKNLAHNFNEFLCTWLLAAFEYQTVVDQVIEENHHFLNLFLLIPRTHTKQ
jgi:hypothetical protein